MRERLVILEGVGEGGMIVQSDGPRPPRRRRREGTPVQISSKAPERALMLLLVENVVHSNVAALMTVPVPVVIGSKSPFRQVGCRTY